MRKEIKNLNLLCIVLLLIICVLSLLIGSVDIDFKSLSSEDMIVLTKIRIPRIVMGVVAGGILSVSGLIIQTLTENELAEPYILGISQGASLGAVLAIIYGIFNFFGGSNIYVGAFLGAILSIVIVLYLTKNLNSSIKLILTGIGIGAIFQALTMLTIYSSKNEAQVRSAMFWLVGSLSGVALKDIYLPSVVLVLNLIIYMKLSKELDLLLLGRKQANYLGLNYGKIQSYLIILTSISTAVVVAKIGVVGFIGLIVPHIAKRLVELKHSKLIPLTVILGGIVTVITDDISRFLFRPEEFPLGIVTSLVGAPLFIFFIMRKRK